jgi:predicted amidohydrolase YtcJ
MSTPAATFVVTGRIATVAGAADAQAMLVRDGRITEVGDRRIVEQARHAGIEVRTFDDQLIVPGFVDPHVHLRHLSTGRGRGVDCRFPHCLSIADVLDALRDGLGRISGGDWLIGYGNLFFDQKIADRRFPTRAELDQVSSSVPIVLHLGGHASVLNTAALRLAGVERFLSGAAGGWGSPVVDVDEHGEPTGLVAEIDPMLPIPEPDPADLEDYVAQTYADLFTRYGVTTIGEMVERVDTADLLSGLIASDRMQARAVLYVMVPAALPLADAIAWATENRTISQRVSTAGLKMFADGGYSSRNAASKTPYAIDHAPHPGYHGVLNLTYPTLRAAIEGTRAAGMQLAVHTNGTAAQEEVLTAVLGAGDPVGHPPVRIEHLGNVVADTADIAGWRRANVRPVLQPAFLYNFVGDFVPMLLGDAGMRGRLPLRSILDGGVLPAASSDVALGAEDEQSNPLFGIWCLLARRSYWQRHIEPTESITFSEALRLFTLEGAKALDLDDQIGSLEPGKRADFVVFDRDPRAHVDDLLRTAVDSVYLDGAPLRPPA